MSTIPLPVPVQAVAPNLAPDLAIDLARRFGLIVAGLAALVAHRFLHEPRLKSLIIPLWTRLTRTAGRFERLMASLAANRAPRFRPSRPNRPKPATAHPTTLPTGHAWLIRALPSEAAIYAGQLEALLAEPGVADLLAASPAAARLIGPLGRMLGLPAFARKRNAPTRRPSAAIPGAAQNRIPPRRATLPPLHPEDPTYRPSAKWLRGPWPARRPRPARNPRAAPA